MKVDFLPLGQLISLVIDYRGKTPHKLGGEWSSSGYRALSALNVKTRRLIAEDKVRFVDEDLYKKWMKEEVQKGDILITSEAPFGQVLQWNSNEKIVLSQRLYALRVKPEYCSSYIYQYMASDFFYGELKARATGSTVEGLRQPALLKCKIAMPPLSVQRRIASILSAYDNLIENNTRRIRLLEQMAENIYKEWFVRFRFPGHENTEFENGLPKGWKLSHIGDECDTIGGGTPSTTKPEYWGGEIKWVTPTDITSKSSIPLLTVEGRITEEGLKKSSAKLLPPYTILMTSRASIGFFGMAPFEVCTNQGFISIVPHQDNLRMYMLYMLKSRKDEILLNANGATFLEISKGRFRKMRMLVPDEPTLNKFEAIVRGIFDTVMKLEQQSTLLARQRDLLLPRLISGKLEVNIDIIINN